MFLADARTMADTRVPNPPRRVAMPERTSSPGRHRRVPFAPGRPVHSLPVGARNRKLRLDPETLRVESFVAAEEGGGRGTVRGHGYTEPDYPSCARTCGATPPP